MVLKALTKPPVPERLLGIDISTNTVALCLFGKNGPITWGEINFQGKGSMDRVMDLGPKLRSLIHYMEDEPGKPESRKLKYDAVAMEAIVYVNNRSTVINMAYAAGAVLSSLRKVPVKTYTPIEWQSFIGNKVLTKAEKECIKKENPGKTDAWYKNQNREFRKNRTRLWVKETYGLDIPSDNVTDAFGVAYKGWFDSRGKN